MCLELTLFLVYIEYSIVSKLVHFAAAYLSLHSLLTTDCRLNKLWLYISLLGTVSLLASLLCCDLGFHRFQKCLLYLSTFYVYVNFKKKRTRRTVARFCHGGLCDVGYFIVIFRIGHCTCVRRISLALYFGHYGRQVGKKHTTKASPFLHILIFVCDVMCQCCC